MTRSKHPPRPESSEPATAAPNDGEALAVAADSAEPAAPGSPGVAPAVAGTMPPAGESTDASLLAAEAALRDAEDRYLRLRAEFENFRRRAQREREQAVDVGVESLAVPLLDVLDNLERALSHSEDAPGPWRDGVALTLRQFAEALRGAGVVAVDPRGEPFDPRFHEALTAEPSGEVPADHVLQVVSRGYRLGDRVLRPARVVVSSGD